MKLMRSIALAGLLATSNVHAGGFPVYSAVEHSQSISQHIEIINDAIVQLEQMGVLDEQLVNQVDSLITQYEQFEQQIRNAIALGEDVIHIADGDLIQILENINSVKRRVERLDPTNPHFEAVLKDQVDSDYGWDDEYSGQVILDHSYGADGSVSRTNEAIARERAEYERYLTERAAQNALTRDRNSSIEDYGTMIDDLGDDSLLQTQHISVSQQNLMLQQQEQIIDRLERLEEREAKKEMQRAASKKRTQDEFEQDVLKTINRKPYGGY